MRRRAGRGRGPVGPFVQACRARVPGVDVRQGVTEDLPYPPAEFDAALASLVVGFMSNPDRGIREMLRVTRPRGTVAVCFWDLNRMPTLQIFWSAAAVLDPTITGNARWLGTHQGELAALLRHAGADDVRDGTINASTEYADFTDWWSAYSSGIGPAGTYSRTLSGRTSASLCRWRATTASAHPMAGSP
jgi:SAM-dependent methyltransferase